MALSFSDVLQSQISDWLDQLADRWRYHPLLMAWLYPRLPKAPVLGERLRLRDSGLEPGDEFVISAFMEFWAIHSIEPLDAEYLRNAIERLGPPDNSACIMARMYEEKKLSRSKEGNFYYWWPKRSLVKAALRQGRCVYALA